MSVLNPFQILLNDLSNELHERNLHSLIHVCGDLIPTGQREKISSGWEAFSILRQLNIIGSEPTKMANLLAIIKELRPKRRDLVHKIKRHIQDNYEEPDLILKDFESSSDCTLPFGVISRPSTPIFHIPQDDCCRIRCCGLACSCNPCCDACCCCVILALLLSFLAIAAALAWYSSIPVVSEYLKSDDHDEIRRAGPFVISILGFLAVCGVLSAIYIRCCRPRDQLNYTVLPTSHEIRSDQASYASSDSAPTTYYSVIDRRIERPRRRECSCSSGQYTASSSVTSGASLRNPPRLPNDVVPDGFPQDDYPEDFAQEVEEVKGDLADLIEV